MEVKKPEHERRRLQRAEIVDFTSQSPVSCFFPLWCVCVCVCVCGHWVILIIRNRFFSLLSRFFFVLVFLME